MSWRIVPNEDRHQSESEAGVQVLTLFADTSDIRSWSAECDGRGGTTSDIDLYVGDIGLDGLLRLPSVEMSSI